MGKDRSALFAKIFSKFKDKDYFTLGNVTQNNIGGYRLTANLKPVIQEYIDEGLLEEAGKKGRYRFPGSATNPLTADRVAFDVPLTDSFTEDNFSEGYRDELEEEIRKHKKFLITTAVMGKDVNKSFLASIKNYAEKNDALLLLLPCEDVASRGKKASPIELSNDLSDFRVVFKETYLNKNLCLCAIKTSAKQINPLSGLDRLPVKMDASLIVASPKVFLKYIPNQHYAVPPALMTTGAVTVNNYDTDKYMSKRTSYLAENDHVYGAVVVEVENENIFHFRHVQAAKDGSFIDLGVQYNPDGSVKKVRDTIMVVGDSHVGYHDKELHERVMELAKNVNTKEVILHDIFHGSSVSHHDVGKCITNALKADENKLKLEDECAAVKSYLEVIEREGFDVTIVKSNHDNHLFRYLNEGRYVSDPINHRFGLKLALASSEGHDPLQYAIEDLLKFKKENIKWLREDEDYRVYGVQVSNHGSSGANGSKGSISVFEKGLGNCVTAHTHSAAIQRDAFCVGTVGLMDMKYNKGLSSWTRTCCLIYNNGTKQLVNFIPDENGFYSFSL